MKKILEVLSNKDFRWGLLLTFLLALLIYIMTICTGCSSPTNPAIYNEESLEDDMEYIDSGKTLSERLKRLR